MGQGVSCKDVKERLHANLSPASVSKILAFLKHQPTRLHTSLVNNPFDYTDATTGKYLHQEKNNMQYFKHFWKPFVYLSGQKKCVIEVLYQYEFFPNILEDLGAELTLSLPWVQK